METKIYSGMVLEQSWGDADDILFLSDIDIPFAEVLEDDISGKMVTARYWISDKECLKEDAQESFFNQLLGIVDGKFSSYYSEITGYLWTDENCKIGGHDIIDEFRSAVGKWLILEVDIHEN